MTRDSRILSEDVFRRRMRRWMRPTECQVGVGSGTFRRHGIGGKNVLRKNGQIQSIKSIDSELRKMNILSSTLTNKSKAAIFLASLTTMV